MVTNRKSEHSSEEPADQPEQQSEESETITVETAVDPVRIWEPGKATLEAPDGFQWWGDVDIQALKWVWTGMIPMGGFTLAAGPPGATKSSLMAEVVARFTNGTIDGYRGDQKRNALWLSREDSSSLTIAPKLTAAKAGPGVMLLDEDEPATGINLATESGLRNLEVLVDNYGIQLLVVDPLTAFVDSKFSMQQNTQKTIQALTPLASLAARKRIAVVGVMHTARGATQASIDSIAGSVGFASTSRHVLLVGRYGANFLVAPVKSNLTREGYGHVYSVDYREAVIVTDTVTGEVEGVTASHVRLLYPSLPEQMMDCLKKQDDGPRSDATIREVLRKLDEVQTTVDTRALHAAMLADDTYQAGHRAFSDLVKGILELGYIRAEYIGYGGDKRRMVWLSPSGRALLHAKADTAALGVPRSSTTHVSLDVDYDDDEEGGTSY